MPHYCGIPFRHSYLRSQGYERGELGVLINVWDGEVRWPLCTGTHPLSEAILDLGEWIRPETGEPEAEEDERCQ